MFDGNHRSKRVINLGSRNRNRRGNNNGPASRSSILQRSKEEREKRLEKNRRITAAMNIQRVYRGYKSRKATIGFLLQDVLSSSGTVSSSSTSSMDYIIRLGSLMQPYGLFPMLQQSHNVKLVLYSFLQKIKDLNDGSWMWENLLVEERYVLFHRILIHCFHELETLAKASNENCGQHEQEQNKVLLDFVHSFFKNVSPSMLTKITFHGSSNAVSVSKFQTQVLQCVKAWLKRCTDNMNSDTDALKVFIDIANQLTLVKSGPGVDTASLFQAHLAAIILGFEISSLQKLGIIPNGVENCLKLFHLMKDFLVSDSQQNESISKLLHGREIILLKNVKDMMQMKPDHELNEFLVKYLGSQLNPIISHSRLTSDIKVLILLSSFKAKGIDIRTLCKGKIPTEVIDLTLAEEDDEDDDDDDLDDSVMEDAQLTQTTSRTSNSVPRLSAKKLRRQDLLTVQKLDKIFKANLIKAQSEISVYLKNKSDEEINPLCDLAEFLGNGEWLSSTSLSDGRDATRIYLFLSELMQSCVGLNAKDSAMSPLLSKLAFNQKFLEGLWKFVQMQYQSSLDTRDETKYLENRIQLFSSLTSFCDLFSQQLLALDDEDFIKAFTTLSGGRDSCPIMAVDVIELVKNVLFELFWKKPVISSDYNEIGIYESSSLFKLIRGRTLLSGTKLWNSIYRRWSRLFKVAKFCDEETWWFPHLVTRHHDEEGAASHVEVAMNRAVEEEEASINSAMQIDEGISNVAETDDLSSLFKDPKMARILVSCPQALPFERRAKLFSSLLHADIAKTQDETAAMQAMMMQMQQGIDEEYTGRERVRIRRDHLYGDSKEQLTSLGKNLKKKVQVTFINKHGGQEAGVDGGGLFKEFLDDLIKNAFDPDADHGLKSPLFVENPLQTLSINTRLKPTSQILQHYQFLGLVLGKAVYESILVEPQFCFPFLNQLLCQQNNLDDLKNVDPSYYKQLSSLRNMNAEAIQSLHLTFDIPIYKEDGSMESVDLIPGGSKVLVTKENIIRYIHLVAHRRLNIDTSLQSRAFLKGFQQMINPNWVRLFSPYELQKVISGDDEIQGFEVKGLKLSMAYGGGYHPSQPYIIWFWDIVEQMTPSERSKLLKFMTSCSRQPLLG